MEIGPKRCFGEVRNNPKMLNIFGTGVLCTGDK